MPAGRPPFVATDDDRRLVETLSGHGVPHRDIRALVNNGNGIDLKTLYKHFRPELDRGKAKANSQVAKRLFEKVLEGDTSAIIFWSKVRLGMSTVAKHELTGADGQPLQYQMIERVIVNSSEDNDDGDDNGG